MLHYKNSSNFKNNFSLTMSFCSDIQLAVHSVQNIGQQLLMIQKENKRIKLENEALKHENKNHKEMEVEINELTTELNKIKETQKELLNEIVMQENEREQEQALNTAFHAEKNRNYAKCYHYYQHHKNQHKKLTLERTKLLQSIKILKQKLNKTKLENLEKIRGGTTVSKRLFDEVQREMVNLRNRMDEQKIKFNSEKKKLKKQNNSLKQDKDELIKKLCSLNQQNQMLSGKKRKRENKNMCVIDNKSKKMRM